MCKGKGYKFLQHLRQQEHVPEDLNTGEHFFLLLWHFVQEVHGLLVLGMMNWSINDRSELQYEYKFDNI